MTTKKRFDILPALSNDQLSEVWGGANRQAAVADRQRIEEMQRTFNRRNDAYSRFNRVGR